ncbi:MAG: Type 4 prepilin-like protein leader peptide-processing enzyme [Candidatus Amesbacteria bacterium GW2011_GWA1_47_20]|uniref:Type 4 prepilin-like protein leader peptide-processing enzyme n=2 Tax=Candidatus Amesiibacteriota TaxID=1752730 RepID=A0A0G1VE95_9BACT|nr:MAG: Type 4 prepilin-like protein leader peptide-processing enzyme [Candidatus Amesbacteria bacterium GW2011_GWA1_47_20]KKU83335.1 MAG: Type 4 prepilin-like protein leader peptide-processing enzyme [Candidatus Amesbacteria bacterium GW2011_GWC2_47_8]
MAILWVTVVIAVMDWETMLVSDWLVGAWAVLAVLSIKYQVSSIYGLLVGIGVIGGIRVLTKKRGMGEGDIGIAAVMGWWLGWPRVAPALWTAFVAGAAYGLWLLAFGKKKMKSKMAFGPWLILGAWIGYVWGDKIIKYVFHT